MEIKIPAAHEEPLRDLATMESGLRERLLGAVQRATSILHPKDLVSRVVAELTIAETRAAKIISMLMSMYRASEGAREEFVEKVTVAAKSIASNADPDAVDWATFSKDLKALLGAEESLGVVAKALSVRSEYGHVYCAARILTDIRPIFGADARQTPLAGAIIHTLRIKYHDGDLHRDYYVALDARDLRELRDQIDRACKKEESLKSLVEESGIQYLSAEHP